MKLRLGANTLVLLTAAWLTGVANIAFFRNLSATHGPADLAVLGLLVFLTCALLGMIGAARGLLKPWLTVLLLIASAAAYFMDVYNVVIDWQMVQNAVQTDPGEVGDLVTGRFWLYLLVIGGLPAVALWRFVDVAWRPFGGELLARAGLLAGCLAVTVLLAVLQAPMLSHFVREEKSLRFYVNPGTPLYGLYRFARQGAAVTPTGAPEEIAENSAIPEEDVQRELIVMVVGETVRADHFSLNGYERETNPLLSQLDVISFSDISACGTSTAISVPCMFSIREQAEFDPAEERGRENVLDLLDKAGVTLLWRDNNSSSKGVAERIDSEDFRGPERNEDCDVECRDIGMLNGLQAFIDGQADGDILIVLHQMGSHGPAYFKRYPEAYRRFSPTCDTARLDECERADIVNSYDNSIVYTDWFLAQVVAFLQHNDGAFETAMMYVGDHGESLGERGLYLHGAPLWLAPEGQTRVPMVFWFGDHYEDVNRDGFVQLSGRPFSHDNVFHTLLGLFEIESDAYRPDLDLLALSREMAGETEELAGPVP